MKTYYISVPITGVVHTIVEAETDEEALDKACEIDARLSFDKAGRAAGFTLESWMAHRQVVSVNIFHGELAEARIDEIEE